MNRPCPFVVTRLCRNGSEPGSLQWLRIIVTFDSRRKQDPLSKLPRVAAHVGFLHGGCLYAPEYWLHSFVTAPQKFTQSRVFQPARVTLKKTQSPKKHLAFVVSAPGNETWPLIPSPYHTTRLAWCFPRPSPRKATEVTQEARSISLLSLTTCDTHPLSCQLILVAVDPPAKSLTLFGGGWWKTR